MIVILSILFILAILAMTGAIVYFSIGHAIKGNKQYELFTQNMDINLIKHEGIFLLS